MSKRIYLTESQFKEYIKFQTLKESTNQPQNEEETLNEGKFGSVALGILMSLGLLSCKKNNEPVNPLDNSSTPKTVTVTADEDNSKETRTCPSYEFIYKTYNDFDGEETTLPDGSKEKIKTEELSDGGLRETKMVIDKNGNLSINTSTTAKCCRNNGTCNLK